MNILAIETSCDETSASVISNGSKVRSVVISSQINIHSKFFGVVPELASRAHINNINPVISQALAQAGISFSDFDKNIDALAFTSGPGLAGALLVGALAAKSLASVFNKPLILGPDSRVLAVHLALQPDEAAEEQDEEGGHGLPGGWHVEQVHVGSLSQLHDDARRGEPTRRPPRTGCSGSRAPPRVGTAPVRGAPRSGGRGYCKPGCGSWGRGAPQSGGQGPSGGAGSKESRQPGGNAPPEGTIAACASPASTT